MEFKENVLDILDIISESNAARRELTRPGKEAYAMDKKVKHLKKLIIDNEAAKKLVARWNKGAFLEKGDSTGKIMLEPSQQKYGGYGAYAVWESVKGISGLYADIKKDGDTKWSFTELWLSEEGAKKLQNNIMPIDSDFRKGDAAFFGGSHEARRRKALKYKYANKEELEKDSKRVSEIRKEIGKDGFDWSKDYDKYDKKRREIENKYNREIQYSNHRKEPKSIKRKDEFEKNLRNIVDPILDKFSGRGSGDKIGMEAWKLSDRRFKIIEQYGKISDVEMAKKIDELKADAKAFLDKYDKKSSVSSEYFNGY